MHELGVVMKMLSRKGRVLEIGAGAGWQAQVFASCGLEVSAIDLPLSEFSEKRVWPIINYDGKQIPFANDEFDVVFSSNVLEHIPDVAQFQKEIHRVLKPDGCAIHVLPSSSWRFWTSVTHILRLWTLPKSHGEHAGNALIEICYFSRAWWRQLFLSTGWNIAAEKTNGLFYTGLSILDSRLSVGARRFLSRVFGSSCNIFLLQKASVPSE